MKSSILIILATISGTWSGPSVVTFRRDQCVLRRASAVIACQYDINGYTATHVGWSKYQQIADVWRLVLLPISQDSQEHYRYVGNYVGDCRLQINDVQYADAGAYFFSFRTAVSEWTSETFAQLFVKELTASVRQSSVVEGTVVRLTCVSGCDTPVNVVWFKDGQPVINVFFSARREDTGRYHCAVWGQERVRSSSVALNVLYPPDRVTLSISPAGIVVRGSSVVLTCSGDASPPVSGYSLYREGGFVSFGQNHTILDVQPYHSGRYHCQAWNNISRMDRFISTVVLLQVYYHPVNISISLNPAHVVWGSSVNLTCSSTAAPPTDSYTWYRRTDSKGSSGLRVGSGQVLSISSMEVSHSGLYLCQARNQLGKQNSTEVLLAIVEEEQQGSQTLLVVAGIGLAFIVAFAFTLLLFWRKKRCLSRQKEAEWDASGKQLYNESGGIYSNIHGSPSPPPDIDRHTNSLSSPQSTASIRDEVIYSSVDIKSRGLGDTDVQGSGSNGKNNTDSVTYATITRG